MNKVKNITSAQDYLNVTSAPGITIIKCGAKWCKPCVSCASEYSEIAKIRRAHFYALDIDDVPDFHDIDIVKTLPTFLIFTGGSPNCCVVGIDFPLLTTTIDRLVQENPSP